MNIGADASIPSRRSWITCPISWTNSKSTKPTANDQPQISAYAAIETSIEAEVVRIFSFGSSSRSALPLVASNSSAAPSGAPTRFRLSRQSPRPEPGCSGSYSRSGGGAGAGGVGAGRHGLGGGSLIDNEDRTGPKAVMNAGPGYPLWRT
jgi:hypothetical protein